MSEVEDNINETPEEVLSDDIDSIQEDCIEEKEVVKIAYNDDGSDSYNYDGEDIEFGSMKDNVDIIRKCLEELGVEVKEAPLRADNLKEFIDNLSEDDGSVVFNLCEGAFDYSAFEMNVAALYELLDVEFTGSGPMALGIALNKGLTKDILSSRGVPTPPYFVALSVEDCEGHNLEYPLIVKPVKEDASLGIEGNSVVDNLEDLKTRVDYVVSTFDQGALVEGFIDGREFNQAILGTGVSKVALPPSEIDFSTFPEGQPKIISYEAKWITDSPLYTNSMPICPAPVTDEEAERLKAVAFKAYDAIGCRDYGRVDMRMDSDGNVFVLEVNPNPDISTDAGLPRAAKCAGLEYDELVYRIVELAVERYEEAEERALELEGEDVEEQDLEVSEEILEEETTS